VVFRLSLRILDSDLLCALYQGSATDGPPSKIIRPAAPLQIAVTQWPA